MTKIIGRTRNTNDTVDISSAVAVNSSTAVVLDIAREKRIFFSVTADRDIWIRFRIANSDNNKDGIPIPRNGYWEMPTDAVYTGEISAMTETGSGVINVVAY